MSRSNQIPISNSSTMKTEKIKLDLPNLAYEMNLAKLYALICWIQTHIKPNPGSFIATVDLYSNYKSDLQPINYIASISELSFYKKIHQVLLANEIIFGKTWQNKKRGFTGIA